MFVWGYGFINYCVYVMIVTFYTIDYAKCMWVLLLGPVVLRVAVLVELVLE